jgi:sugar phosphate permease
LDRFDKKLLMVIFLLMLALMMTFMALFSGQIVIVIAFCIGVFLSMLRPLIDTQITLLTHQSWIGEIT